MKTEWFNQVVQHWSSKLSWSERDCKKAAQLLRSISEFNGGEIAQDIKIPEELASEFAVRRAEDALQRRMNWYARSLREKWRNPIYSEEKEEEGEISALTLKKHHWKPCININSADAAALQTLPGIGVKTASLIIKYRQKEGKFTSLEELDKIEGIGEETIKEIKDKIFFGEEDRFCFMTKELSDFISNPTFRNYTELIAETKGSFIWRPNNHERPEEQVMVELQKTLEDIRTNPFEKVRNLHLTRASTAFIEKSIKEKAKSIKNLAVESVKSGALLYDTAYLPFLKQLLLNAHKSIRLMIFFLRYEEEQNYPANPLVHAIIDAHKRGVAVKVILDKDEEDISVGSRFINQPVYDLLKRHNIPVKYDREDRLTHTKLLIVDGTHVVVGSHNWTGGSFFSYDDTSIYVASEELAKTYEEIFDGFWKEYDGTGPVYVSQRVRCIQESPKGENLKFEDQKTKIILSRREFCDAIKEGKYPEYHIRKIRGKLVPVSNPNFTTADNLD